MGRDRFDFSVIRLMGMIVTAVANRYILEGTGWLAHMAQRQACASAGVEKMPTKNVANFTVRRTKHAFRSPKRAFHKMAEHL